MTRRALAAAWWAWALLVAFNYFTFPGDPLVVTDGQEVFPAHDWPAAVRRAGAALLGAAAVLSAGWAVGRTTLWRSSGSFACGCERRMFELAIGLGGLSYACLALAFLGLYRPAVVIVLLAIAGSAGVALAAREWAGLSRSAFRPPGWIAVLSLTVAAAAATFALVGALAPETEYDALWYHLWLPSKWLATGGPVDLVDEYISLYPLTWDLLAGAAMALGGPIAAKLLHFSCLPLLTASTWLLARRVSPRASGPVAILLLVTAPVVTWEATTAYVDLALAWYVVLAAIAIGRFHETRARGWLWIAAVTIGLALAIKHLALVALAVSAATLLVMEHRRHATALACVRTVVLFVAVSLVFPAPWYLRAYARSGNPVFPDMYSVFGARPAGRWDDLSEANLRGFKERFGPGRRTGRLLALPWDVTVHAERYGGTVGPVFLTLLPAALVTPGARWLLLVCGAYALAWASPLSSFQVRFLIPMLPFLAIASAGALRNLPRASLWLVVALSVLNLPPFVEWHERDRVGWTGWLNHVMRGAPLAVVVGGEREFDYLARRVPSFRAWVYANRHLPPTARVLTFSGGDHLYSQRDRLWSDATRARDATWGAPAETVPLSTLRQRLARLGVTHVLVDRRLLDGAAGKLAITSDAMRACCYAPIFDDGRFVLYRVE